MPKLNGRYFAEQTEGIANYGVLLDFEAGMAVHLIEHFAVIAAKTDGEDKSGRSKIELQTPEELVDRCFAIAKAFIAKAEAQGSILEAKPIEERTVNAGLLERLRHENSYLGSDDAPTSIQEISDRIAKRRQEKADREAARQTA